MNLTEKSAYLKGMASGMELDTAKKEGKIIAALLDLVEEMAGEIAALKNDIEEIDDDLDYLNDYIEEIDDDLEAVEDLLGDELEDEEDAMLDAEDASVYTYINGFDLIDNTGFQHFQNGKDIWHIAYEYNQEETYLVYFHINELD